MGEEMKVWKFNGREVRTIQKGGETWWLLRDACDCVGVGNSSDVASRLDDDEKGVDQIDTLGGRQKVVIINESGLYSLIMRSEKPEAKAFKKWVTSEVLPAIRKHGAYLTPARIEEFLADPDTIIRLCTDLKAERQLRIAAEGRAAETERENQLMLPLARYADEVLVSSSLLTINTVAADLGVSRVKLYEFLRYKRVVYKEGRVWHPYAEYRAKGFFDYDTFKYEDSKGESRTREHMKVTQEGRKFIIELWSKEKVV